MSVESSERRTLWSRIALVIAGVVVALLLFVGIWVAVRGAMARTELLHAVPLAQKIETAAVTGRSAGIAVDVHKLQHVASRARSLTSDPVWRAAELIPGVGPNLVAFRQSAAVVDEVSVGGIPPLVTLATNAKLRELLPKNGVFNLALFTRATPSLAKARSALDSAKQHASKIKAGGTIGAISSAVRKLVGLVDKTTSAVDGIDTAAKLLPTMLGQNGSRSYLLLSLNSSELRTPGGIPGAIAVINASGGRLTLDQRTSATALGRAASPVLPLTAAEKTLYDERLGTYMQDVVSTPNFERSGQLAQAMWKLKTGETIDGVVAIDPVALGYILSATGPVDVGSGVTLTSRNAATFLLSTVYAQIPDTTKQDQFFAGATRAIFAVMTDGALDSNKLLNALSRSAMENRIHIWSAHPSEERELAGSTLAGGLPVSTAKKTAFGVYLNDATGAKMDFYLRDSIAVSSGLCRADARPNFDVSVKLSLRSPLDAATSLPSYVTGRYAFGVEPGRVRTNVYVYAPAGAQPYSVTIDGKEYAFVSATLDGHPVVGAVVEMGSHDSATMKFRFVGKAGEAVATSLQHTPMSSPVRVSVDKKLDCAAL